MADEETGLWLSISALAEAKGVSQQAISKRVARLRKLGLIATRPGARGAIEINVAEFDRATRETTDLGRATTHLRPPAAGAPADEDGVLSYTKQQALRTSYAAELARLDLEERKGRLVETAAVCEGYDRAAEIISAAIGDLESHADDLAAVVARDGARGLSGALKGLGRDLLRRMSDALAEEARILRNALPDDASNSRH